MSTDRTSNLAASRRELLRRRITAENLTERSTPGPAPVPVPERQELPLSPGQLRMWSLQQLDPRNVGYNITIALDVLARLDPDALSRALDALVARHDVLRTTYRMRTDGSVVQTVHDQLPAAYDVYDSTDPTRIDELAGELAAQPFDLSTGSPLRVRLIHTGPATATLIVVAHHITWDDGASGVFFGELLAGYRMVRTGKAPDRCRAARQFAEVAGITGAGPVPPPAAGLAFWRRTLDPLPEVLDLPLPHIPGGAGQERFHPLCPGAGRRARELARRHGASLYMVLFAAVSALLHRYTGANTFLVGAPVVNRDVPGGDEVIGYLGNTLPLRAEVFAGDSFATLLVRARTTCLEAYAHSDVELDEVARAVDPQRRRGDAGLFTVVLSLRSPVLALFRAAGLEVSRRQVPGSNARFALTLAVETDGDDLTVEANFPAGDSAYALVGQLLEHLDTLLGTALANPDTAVGDLEMVGREERRQLQAWNDTAAEAPGELLPVLFAAQVARTPEATALQATGTVIVYQELAARANRLARHLAARGIGPEDTVALVVPPSVEQVTAVFGVLTAGAAYLPVDPDYPAERVQTMLTDSRPALVVTMAAHRQRLPALPALPVLVLDDPVPSRAIAGLPAHEVTDADRATPLHPDHPAYVIYTSGSTGVPKGVVVAHRALANHLSWAVHRFAGLAGHAVMHTSLSFDFSVTAMHGALISGGVLELCADNLVDATGTATFLKITPSHLPLLGAVPAAPEDPRTLVVAGEALHGAALAAAGAPQWLASGTDVLNEYGPTETTVGCLLHVISEPVRGPVPVGMPVDNTTCHVLDAGLRLVPAGVPGELYVGGVQLARGYLGQPGLTASRFVADPWSRGQRLYRTGDLVRRRPDGALQFRGRTDDQVKVRGFRVEPGEIEAVLASHPAVTRAVVIGRDDRPGGRYLAGYVVPATGTAADPEELRAHVAAVLPEYLVPAVVTVLDRVPLSPSGKIDRGALPPPAAAQSAPAALAGPSSPTERQLAELFAQALGRGEVGVHDSFFELGGDSIVAIQLAGRARKAGLLLSPRQIFEHRTVAALAASLPAAAPPGTPAAPPAGDGVGTVDPTPIMRAFAERGPVRPGHRMSVLIELPEGLGSDHLIAALQVVLDHHDVLRMRVRPDGGLEARAQHAVPAVSLLHRAAGGDLEIELAAAVGRLDPGGGVVLQSVEFPRARRLLLVAHHLVVDGVSLRILAEDLAAAWQALASGRQPTLPPVGTSFRRWTGSLAERAAERISELARWRELLAGPDPLLGGRRIDLQRDTWASVRTLTVDIDPDTTAELITSVPAAFFAGVDDVLLAGLGLALACWRPGARSALVLLEGHGREETAVPGSDLSRTVGWFTSQHPVRLDTVGLDIDDAVAGGPEAGAMVKRVKEHLRSLPDRGLGYGMLRYLHPPGAAELSALPEPQIGFNYLGRFDITAAEELSAAYDPVMPLGVGLVINAITRDGPAGPRLTAHWMYASGVFSEPEVAALAEYWSAALAGLVHNARRPGSGGHTPSDMPLVSLDQAQLDALEARWRKA